MNKKQERINFLCNRGRHKFKPRYDITAPKRPLPMIISSNIAKTYKQLIEKIYIHDVCIRCGKTTTK